MRPEFPFAKGESRSGHPPSAKYTKRAALEKKVNEKTEKDDIDKAKNKNKKYTASGDAKNALKYIALWLNMYFKNEYPNADMELRITLSR